MTGTRQHYERAFEVYLRRQGAPYVLVDDAKRAILPEGARPALLDGEGREHRLKSFDAVVYGRESHLLVEVKGRRVDLRRGGSGRRESWTTMDDVRSLMIWQELFGEGFGAVLVFMYGLDGPTALSGETGLHRFEGRVYAHRAVRLGDYTREMKVRRPRWGTVDLPAEAFDRISRPVLGLLGAGPVAASMIESAPPPDRPVEGVWADAAAGRERGARLEQRSASA